MLVVVREVPDFASEAEKYIGRHGISPHDFVELVDRLVRTEGFKALDDKIFGLRAAALRGPDGSEGTLLVIDHKTNRRRIVILVSILDQKFDQLAWQSKSPSCKKRINIAVATLIATCRNGDLISGLCGAVG
jgi:hypothetical protein